VPVWLRWLPEMAEVRRSEQRVSENRERSSVAGEGPGHYSRRVDGGGPESLLYST
jgi:hypothetical protein